MRSISHAASWVAGKFGAGPDAAAAKAMEQNPENTGQAAVVRLNKKLEGTGFTAMGAGQYKDSQGHVIGKDALPPEIKTKLDGAGLAPTTPAAVTAQAQKVDQGSTENAEMKTAAAAPVASQTTIIQKAAPAAPCTTKFR